MVVQSFFEKSEICFKFFFKNEVNEKSFAPVFLSMKNNDKKPKNKNIACDPASELNNIYKKPVSASLLNGISCYFNQIAFSFISNEFSEYS